MSEFTVEQRRHSAVIDFAHALVNAGLNRLLHARDSRFVQEAMQEVVTTSIHAAKLGVTMPLRVQLDEISMHHDGKELDGPSLQARGLIRNCRERSVTAIQYPLGCDAAETNRMFDLLLMPENIGALAPAHRSKTLQRVSLRNIVLEFEPTSAPAKDHHGLDAHGRALDHYQDLADVLQQNHRLAQGDHELAVDATATAVERMVMDFDEPSMLLALAMKDDVDRFTVGHSVRVALLALQVARAVGAKREQLVHIGGAALMHDIGKSKVPQEILFKRGRLTSEEWQCMAQHPRLGAQILIEQHENVDPRTIGAAFCHHMGPDGSGYPEPLLPTPPSSTSRLIRVCDVFEALTAVRPYKKAMTPIEAFAIMFRNERDFDPDWLRSFCKTVGLFPSGTRLELEDGSAAVVMEQTNDIRKPRIRLLTGPSGADLPSGHPGNLIVGEPFEGQVPRIAGVCTHDRFLPIPEFDEHDPAMVGPTAHDACLAQPDHDHQH